MLGVTADCSEEGCDDGKRVHARGLCRSHYVRALGLVGLRDLLEHADDGARGPNDLPVAPKAVGLPGRGRWVVMMPYPSLDGTQPCAQDPDLFSQEPKDRGREARSVNNARAKACRDCPFLVSCREWATAHEEFGYWGGLSETRRRQRRLARGQVLVNPLYAGTAGFTGRDWGQYLEAVGVEPVADPDGEVDWYEAAPL